MDPIYASPARIQLRASYGDLLSLAKQHHALDPSVLEETPPFFFDAEASSNRLDAYYTRMAASSLKNYAAEADEGRSFQNSHRWMELPLGRTLNAQYEDMGGGVARMVTSVYIVPALNINGVNTSDFIRAVRAGVVSDVSIGFSGGQFRCSICGQNLMGMDCPHIPGFEYDTTGADGETRREVAIAWVDGAHLSEVSAVYDGATPGACVLKATQEAEAGRLMPEKARVIEARYRVQLPGARHVYPGVTLPREEPMPPIGDAVVKIELEGLDEARALLAEWGEAETVNLADWARALKQANSDLTAKVNEMTPLAEMGRAYRADLIEDTLREGIRAFGAAFPEATYRQMLDTLDLAGVKTLRDYHAGLAAQAFPGGRVSVDTVPVQTGDSQTAPKPEDAAPDHVFLA